MFNLRACVMRGALAPHPCQLGRLQCVWSVLAEEYRDILAVFFTSFLLFVWALRPASLDEDEDEEDDHQGRGPSSRRRAKGPAAAARRGSRTNTMPERPDRPRERRRESGRWKEPPSEQAAYTRVKSSSRPASALDAGGPAASPREESLSSADEVPAGLRPGSWTAPSGQAAYTRVKSSSSRNGGSFAAARAMYRAGQRQEAAEQRAEKAAAAAGTVDARALLKSSFPAAFQSAEARDGGALTDRDARSLASDEVPASANRERAESPPHSSTPPASGFEPHELHRCAPTLESAGGEGHDAVLLAARLRQGAPARQRRQSQKMQSEVSGEKRAGRRPLISKSQSSGSNFYAYVVLKRTASDEQKGKFSSAV